MKRQSAFKFNIFVKHYTKLYCKRKKVDLNSKFNEAVKSWYTLTPAERQLVIDNYNKCQEEKNKKIANTLQFAEPYMKPKKEIKKNTHEENVIHKQNEKDDYDDNQTHSTIYDAPLRYDDSASIAYSHHNDPTLNCDDSTSNVDSVPTASGIDAETDEARGPQETNTTAEIYFRYEPLPEPAPVTVKSAAELFESLKSSGVRPDLATVTWKEMSRTEKSKYNSALKRMQKQYLIQLEQYLDSLPDEDLFKYYTNKFNL